MVDKVAIFNRLAGNHEIRKDTKGSIFSLITPYTQIHTYCNSLMNVTVNAERRFVKLSKMYRVLHWVYFN
jgi:hypothetical protein